MSDIIETFTAKENRIKVILVIVAFLFVFYLIYDTFFAGSTPSAPPAPVAVQQPAPADDDDDQAAAATRDTGQQQVSLPSQPEQANFSPVREAEPMGPTPQQLALLAESQAMQKEYLKLVGEYQLAQLQQKLAQANAGIAAAKLESAKTMAETQSLSKQLRQQQSLGVSTTTEQVTPTISLPSSGKGNGAVNGSDEILTAKYVGKKQGKWIAVLAAGDDFFEVKPGTTLPDGSRVKSINSKGVTLMRGNQARFLPIPKSLN